MEDRKQEVIRQSEALSILVRAFREFQFEEEAQLRAKSRQDEAMTVRRYEVLNKTIIKILKTVKRYTYMYLQLCFKRAEWRLTEADGQIGIADVTLSNLLY